LRFAHLNKPCFTSQRKNHDYRREDASSPAAAAAEEGQRRRRTDGFFYGTTGSGNPVYG
jgi:hypothetical protein